VPVSPRKARVACSISLILLLANCGDNPTGLAGKPGIRAVAGAGITDTVDAAPLQALVVEVRDQNGALASGVVVRFEPKPVGARLPTLGAELWGILRSRDRHHRRAWTREGDGANGTRLRTRCGAADRAGVRPR